ncbi:MAG: hypothetical protein ACOYMF_18315 [Bacteroidales bacterium]
MNILEAIIQLFTPTSRTAQGICGGYKAIGTVSAEITLAYPSWIQNRGADGQVLAYEDEYGNVGSITMKENEITPARIAKILTGSGASMYKIYAK